METVVAPVQIAIMRTERGHGTPMNATRYGARTMPIPAPETEVVSQWKVACDGGDGALGHPRVWLTIPHEAGFVECGYCDKRYEIDRAHAHDDH